MATQNGTICTRKCLRVMPHRVAMPGAIIHGSFMHFGPCSSDNASERGNQSERGNASGGSQNHHQAQSSNGGSSPTNVNQKIIHHAERIAAIAGNQPLNPVQLGRSSYKTRGTLNSNYDEQINSILSPRLAQYLLSHAYHDNGRLPKRTGRWVCHMAAADGKICGQRYRTKEPFLTHMCHGHFGPHMFASVDGMLETLATESLTCPVCAAAFEDKPAFKDDTRKHFRDGSKNLVENIKEFLKKIKYDEKCLEVELRILGPR